MFEVLFYTFAAATCVVIGFLRGGNFRNLPLFNRLWLPPLAAVLQASTVLVPATTLSLVLLFTSYVLLIWFLASNWRFVGLRLLAVGLGLNLLVMGANGGRMPASMEAAEVAGVSQSAIAQVSSGMAPKHMAITDQTRLAFLADQFPLKYPIRKVISVGDTFILLGSFLLVQECMGRRVTIFG